MLHRDIKPSNILISAEGQPLLLDFNLAQDAARATRRMRRWAARSPTWPPSTSGPWSAAPDAARLVDQRSDIYSLGMVLAEMLTGHSPFEQSASYSALPAPDRGDGAGAQPEAPVDRGRRPDIPWGLESIVRKCLAPDPARRYQQAEHLAEDLRRFLDDRPLEVRPGAEPGRAAAASGCAATRG